MSTVEENVTRVYTINLGRAWLTPEHKRTDRVVNMIREFAEKHMKSSEVKLDQDLNRQIWSRGKTNPPRKVRVKMVKDEDDVVTVSLYEEPAESAPAPAPAATTTTETPAMTTEAKPAAEETKAEEEKKTQ
ncbi:50S ribosomal protein L31e [Nitrososphaera viennensis]|uniref:Large ribosomal subunit protein eL31 n=2 Tax=Nitrososphaera viennensis TaxID=1034015 RepID=A0A060HIG5_9ARCH|nr:50S ribosomal protein L31e [Nitrososphaera viennensis]AIC15323.1 50S ribosomal protein L31e [Nitrososphaera viennensis EN76]UVS70223.1 60S ribosomal protein L31 [Nitrososphaera viennensis]